MTPTTLTTADLPESFRADPADPGARARMRARRAGLRLLSCPEHGVADCEACLPAVVGKVLDAAR